MDGTSWSRRVTATPTRTGACGIIALLMRWCDRVRERRTLAELDDRTLHDIGISRIDAAQEWSKPFWRP
jgi:uncharacterized protein YjiS (DUF1127 family)